MREADRDDAGIHEILCYFCCIVSLLYSFASGKEVSAVCPVCGGAGLYMYDFNCGRRISGESDARNSFLDSM